MIIKRYDNVTITNINPPQNGTWESDWDGFSGYYAMNKCHSMTKWSDMKNQRHLTHEKGHMTLGEFQKDCFFSTLADIKKENVNFIELGSGWGRLCLSLAGAIDNKVIEMIPRSYRCLAVEAEPVHYNWNKKHFDKHDLNGDVVMAAISDKNGVCRFNVGTKPDEHYGQTVFDVPGFGIKSTLKRIYKRLKSKTIKVPMYTVDHLIEKYKFAHLDILQMDVQGYEDRAIIGAEESIRNNLIDYIIVGTHKVPNKDLNDIIRNILIDKYDVVLDIKPREFAKIKGFPTVEMHDGLQLFKSKNI